MSHSMAAAPRDGTRIVGYLSNGHAVIVHWSVSEDGWCDGMDYMDVVEWNPVPLRGERGYTEVQFLYELTGVSKGVSRKLQLLDKAVASIPRESPEWYLSRKTLVEEATHLLVGADMRLKEILEQGL